LGRKAYAKKAVRRERARDRFDEGGLAQIL
jgi:hypothetical protein